MEIDLLNIYPLELEIDNKSIVFLNPDEHVRYVYYNTVAHFYYDNIFLNNIVLQSWNNSKKLISKESALYRHQNLSSSEHTDLTIELEKEFDGIITTLPLGQILFRDTTQKDIPSKASTRYMPTSIIPSVYVSSSYDTTLILTIKSSNIKCHYYGESESGTTEWEVLLQKGLILTKTEEYTIPTRSTRGREVLSNGERIIIKYDVTNN